MKGRLKRDRRFVFNASAQISHFGTHKKYGIRRRASGWLEMDDEERERRLRFAPLREKERKSDARFD